jgi:hypothetical protein
MRVSRRRFSRRRGESCRSIDGPHMVGAAFHEHHVCVCVCCGVRVWEAQVCGEGGDSRSWAEMEGAFHEKQEAFWAAIARVWSVPSSTHAEPTSFTTTHLLTIRATMYVCVLKAPPTLADHAGARVLDLLQHGRGHGGHGGVRGRPAQAARALVRLDGV